MGKQDPHANQVIKFGWVRLAPRIPAVDALGALNHPRAS